MTLKRRENQSLVSAERVQQLVACLPPSIRACIGGGGGGGASWARCWEGAYGGCSARHSEILNCALPVAYVLYIHTHTPVPDLRRIVFSFYSCFLFLKILVALTYSARFDSAVNVFYCPYRLCRQVLCTFFVLSSSSPFLPHTHAAPLQGSWACSKLSNILNGYTRAPSCTIYYTTEDITLYYLRSCLKFRRL